MMMIIIIIVIVIIVVVLVFPWSFTPASSKCRRGITDFALFFFVFGDRREWGEKEGGGGGGGSRGLNYETAVTRSIQTEFLKGEPQSALLQLILHKRGEGEIHKYPEAYCDVQ